MAYKNWDAHPTVLAERRMAEQVEELCSIAMKANRIRKIKNPRRRVWRLSCLRGEICQRASAL
jgi:hypothetical protein